MSGVMFFIWIPSEQFQTEQRNKRFLDRMDNVNEKLKNNDGEILNNQKDETDVQSGAGGGESSNGSVSKKKFPSQNTFVSASLENDSIERHPVNDRYSLKEPVNLEELKSLLEQNGDSRASCKSSISRNISATDPSECAKSSSDESEGVDENSSMEKVLSYILRLTKISNYTWQVDRGNFYQIVFSIETGSRCDDLIHLLSEWGIGQREGSSISIIPCALYYDATSGREELDETKSLSVKDSAWTKFISSVRARLNVAKIVEEVKSDAALSFDFIILLIVASILAAFGLVEDNTLFLAASMLISPLMGPIMAATFGAVIKDVKLHLLGIKNELIGLFMVIFVGLLMGIILNLIGTYEFDRGITNEMYNRGTVHALTVGIMIALPSGAAVALAILGENVGSLVGVAISASLLPPAVNAGLMWSLSLGAMTNSNFVVQLKLKDDYKPNYSANAVYEFGILGCVSMCVTLTNILCIYIMGIIFLKIKEVAPNSSPNQRQFWKFDIKAAREFNKNYQHNDANIDTRLIDEIHEHPTVDFRGVGRELLLNHQTWSPMTLRHRCAPIRTSIKELEALYYTMVGNNICERTADVYKTSRLHESPDHAHNKTDPNNTSKKWFQNQGWYSSTKHTHDDTSQPFKHASSNLEKIIEMKMPLTPNSTDSAPKEVIVPSKRIFTVTLAEDQLMETK